MGNETNASAQPGADLAGQDELALLRRRVAELEAAEQECKQTKQALRESEARYRALAETTVAGIGIADSQENLTFVNQAFARMLGYTQDELLGQSLAQLTDAAEFAAYQELTAQRKRGNVSTYETTLRHKDGGTRDLLISASPLITDDGHFEGTLAVVVDITARKRAENALREERDKAQRYLDIAGTIIVALDAEQNVTLVNKAGCEILGYPQEAILGQKWFDTFVPERIRAEVKAGFAELLAGRTEGVEHFENPIAGRDGEERLVRWYNTILRDPAGHITGTLSSGQDITLQKQTEAELSRLAAVIEQASESIVITDPRGKIQYVNPYFERLTGYSAAEVIGSNPRILKSDYQDQAFYKKLWDTITAGQTWQGVFINRRKDGSLYHEEATIFPIQDAGKTVSYTAVKRDITERVRAESALRETLARTEALYYVARSLIAPESTHDLLQTVTRIVAEVLPADRATLHLLDLDARQVTHFVKGGPGARHAVEIPFSELTDGLTGWVLSGSSPRPALSPKEVPDPRESPEVQQRRAATNCGAVMVVPLRSRGQTLGTMTAINRPNQPNFTRADLDLMTAMANQVAIAIENARLVEELEQQVAARTAEIRSEKEKSDTILRSVGDAISMFNLDKRIAYVNPAFAALTGYGAEEAVGRPADLAIATEPSAPEQQALQTAIASGEIWHGEMTIRRKDGRTYEAAVAVAPVHDDAGQLAGYVSSHRDISHLKELEQARSRFMAHVSHELRTPVTNIKLYTRLLRNGYRSEKTAQYLQALDAQAGRLQGLVQDILEITELDAGQAVANWEPVSLQDVIAVSVARYHDLAAASGLRLVAAPGPPDLPAVKGDPARLIQALTELVENALIFTPAGGQVVVEAGTATEGERRWITVAVRDTGPGISPREQERVFERFYRGSLAQSGHIPGTGLGLAICKEIVERHGGQIRLASQAGQGSAFTVWLPAA